MIYRSCLPVALAAALSPAVAAATTYVATPSNFAQVFMTAQAGDAITLHGSFGAVTLADRSFAVPLRIDASDATFSDTLLIKQVTGLAFTGGYFGSTTGQTRYDKAVAVYQSGTVSFAHAYVVGAQTGQGIAFIDSTDVAVTKSVFDGLSAGATITGSTGGVLDNNRSINSSSDGFDIVNSHGVSVTNSTCSDGAPGPGAHPDCVQLYSILGNAPQSDITILNNVARGPTQGFTSFNPDNGGGVRIDISHNQVATSYPQGIACYACVDSTFAFNTLTTLPGARYRTSFNIVGGGDNVIFGNTTDGAAAPNDPDPTSVSALSSGLAADVAWTPLDFENIVTSAFAGDAVANPLRSTVPEPGMWALMTVGFGALGRAMRRRRAVAA